MPLLIRFTLIVLVASGLPVHAAELFVDGSAAAGGNGAADKPFQTVAQAIAAARGGDVVTIRKGVYREGVAIDKSGTAEQPTTLRAAAGQRVILSGFAPITGWKPFRESIQSAVVEGPIEDLFVGLAMQSVSRWPSAAPAWRTPSPAGNGSLRDEKGLAAEKALTDVAAKPAGARLYFYMSAGNFYTDAPLTKLDLTSGTLTSEQTKTIDRIKGGRDRYQIINHVSLITGPGQWAFEPIVGKKTRIYFWPARAEDLQNTQYRQLEKPLVRVGHWKNTVSHVRVEGLEVTGARDTGIELGRAEHATVTRCIVHHNARNGISARRGAHLEIDRNIVVANGNGVGVTSSHDVVVQRNEIASNMVDGLTVAGNVSGKPDGEPTTRDVIVRRNYIHHHLLLGHPDNMQTYRGVEKLTIEDNVLLWGGQGIMTEETDRSVVKNSVIFGTGAVAVIFGHSNASEWTVEGCTIGLGGWGALSLTAKQYQIHHNIFYHNGHGLGETISADYNLFATSSPQQAIAIVAKPKFKSYSKIDEVAAATGQQKHSVVAEPQFRSAPSRQAMTVGNPETAPNRLFVRGMTKGTPTEGFAAGDQIEISGDGVLRKVTAVDDKSLTFDPPLPMVPFRDALVWNWKNSPRPVLDLRPAPGSPALTAGKDGRPIGATLDIGAFQRGDFDGDGQRDLPELPEDVKAAWPNPNALTLPLHGA